MQTATVDIPSIVELNCTACGHIHTLEPRPESSISAVVHACHSACPSCGENNYLIKLVNIDPGTRRRLEYPLRM